MTLSLIISTLIACDGFRQTPRGIPNINQIPLDTITENMSSREKERIDELRSIVAYCDSVNCDSRRIGQLNVFMTVSSMKQLFNEYPITLTVEYDQDFLATRTYWVKINFGEYVWFTDSWGESENIVQMGTNCKLFKVDDTDVIRQPISSIKDWQTQVVMDSIGYGEPFIRHKQSGVILLTEGTSLKDHKLNGADIIYGIETSHHQYYY